MGRGLTVTASALALFAAQAPAAVRHVCERNQGHGCFARIQDAIDAARLGDTVRVPDGTYRESLVIRKRGLRLIGNAAIPAHVRLAGGGKRRIAVLVRRARNVVVRGFAADHFTASGFVAADAPGFVFRNVVATHTGDYGLRADRSPLGVMQDAAASQNRISGVLATTGTVRGVSAFLNPVGLRGRYVRVAGSTFFNNGVGIVAAKGEATIIDNDIFWNNFDYTLGAPFRLVDPRLPIGTGVLFLPGSFAQVHRNRIFGQFRYGLAASRAAVDFRRNSFGFNALAEDPAPDPNATDAASDVRRPARGDDPEAGWVRHEHPEIEGFDPVEHWTPDGPKASG